MKSRLIAMVASALLSSASSLLACELNGLTEAIDRLKGGAEPNAGSVAFACVSLIQNRDVEKNAVQLMRILHSTFDNDLRLKESIGNCSVDLLRRAC